jgi:hypothetical protein
VAHGRRKVTEGEAAELVSAWRASRRALPGWCAAQGLDGRSLRNWVRRLSSPTTIRLMEVAVAPPRASPPLRVLVGDVSIEVPNQMFGATAADASVRVVVVQRTGALPRRPCWRIARLMRLRLTRKPVARSSECTLGLP